METDINIDEKINDTINSVFPVLIIEQKKVLVQYITYFCNAFVQYNLGLSAGERYQKFKLELTQNDNRGLKWILTLLLPHIDNFDIQVKHIYDLSSIYTEKVPSDKSIDDHEPKYIYSNIQYGRCLREDKTEEIKFSMKHLEHNFILLLETIKMCSNRLFVNWIDIFPMPLETYKNYSVYSNTSDIFQNNNFKYIQGYALKEQISKPLNEGDPILNALPIDTIYNTISNNLYEDIKKIKWTIYSVPCITYVNGSLKTKLITIFAVILDILGKFKLRILSEIQWNDLNISIQNEFKDVLNAILSDIDSGENIENTGDTSYKIESYDVKNMITQFYLSLLKSHFLYSSKISEKMVKSIQKNIFSRLENGTKINYGMIRKYINKIDPSVVFEFLRETSIRFKSTWYGSVILNEDKTKIKNYFHPLSNKISYFTYKNVYNFCKALVRYNKNDVYERYGNFWCSLSNDNKDTIIERLSHDNIDDAKWFNISGFIKRMNLEKITGMPKKYINGIIYEFVRDNICDFVFETLIYQGTLSIYVPRPEISVNVIDNKKKAVEDNHNIFNKNGPHWKSGYHFLADLPYSKMSGFQVEYGGKEIDIFTLYSEPKYGNASWYMASTLNWIAQIGFCHHFLNNRVTFITGSTGVGKTTQVPKLYLYYLKALDHNINGRVVCSQPRKDPTTANAFRVAKELGLPIYQDVHSAFDEKNTELFEKSNTHIQYKHKTSSNLDYIRQYFLKYETDGTLMTEINHPLLIRNAKLQDKTILFTENVYDVIMIDETHEHNKNMDLLLTFMRNGIMYNPSVRLVIMSATMDDDEPNYRRYFRMINDNVKYPLNTLIKDEKIDRINCDRRYHISPPGAGTQFEIIEHYHEKYNINNKPPNANMLGNFIINEILEKYSEGDILVFQPGAPEIEKLIEYLNEHTGSNIIAIPYYSELGKVTGDEWKKNLVTEIDKTISKLIIPKNMKMKNATEKEAISKTDVNIYKRAIIIATNAAEASLTLPSVKHVVDIGYSKVNRYDYHTKVSRLLLEPISDSSRKQRKGRVGRTSSGIVHYLYDEDFTKNNKIKFSIAIEDITFDILKKLRNGGDVGIMLKDFHDRTARKQIMHIQDKFVNSEKNTLDKIIEKYFYTDSETIYEYYGDDEMYDYKNDKFDIFVYDGYTFSLEQLLDVDGKFYIIHPDEEGLERNIVGKIINVSKKYGNDFFEVNKKKISKKMESFISMLYDYEYLIKEEKTLFGDVVVKLYERLTDTGYDVRLMIRTLIFGIALGCGSEIIKLYAFLTTFDFKLTNFFIGQISEGNSRIHIQRNSDVHVLLDLLSKIHTVMKRSGFINITYNMIMTQCLLSSYDKSVDMDIIRKVYSKIYTEIGSGRSVDVRQIVNFYNIQSNSVAKYIDKYDNFRIDLEWIIKNKIGEKTFITLLDNIRMKYYNSGVNITEISTETLSNTNKIENVTYSLLLGHPLNLVKRINGNFMSIYSLLNKNNIDSDEIVKKMHDKGCVVLLKPGESFIKVSQLNYALYLANGISGIYLFVDLKSSDIALLENIYNGNRITNIADIDYSNNIKTLDIEQSINEINALLKKN